MLPPTDDSFVDDYEVVVSPYCPTCGQRTRLGANPEWLLLHFRGKYAALLSYLIESRMKKKARSLTEIIREVYADYPDGPPDSAASALKSIICKNQEKLVSLGWMIVTPNVTGCGYMLVPFEVAVGDDSPFERIAPEITS